MDALTLRTALERAWTATTTYCPEDWEEHDPAWGQCAVSSVFVRDVLGGELRHGLAELPDGRQTRHYWNRIDGLDLDLTWRQFPAGTALVDLGTTTRADLIANRWMEARYLELRVNVERELSTLEAPVAASGIADRLAAV